MINKELFDKTISILVKAYFDNTLIHGKCRACAVGNLVRANGGFGEQKIPEWILVFSTFRYGTQYRQRLQFNLLLSVYGAVAKKEIDSTGYKAEDLAKIEYAFEYNADLDKSNFDGLMRVVNVLQEIHQCNDEEIIKTKDLFLMC